MSKSNLLLKFFFPSNNELILIFSFTFDGLWSERQNVEKVICELLEHLLEPELPKDVFKSEIYDKKSNTGVM